MQQSPRSRQSTGTRAWSLLLVAALLSCIGDPDGDRHDEGGDSGARDGGNSAAALDGSFANSGSRPEPPLPRPRDDGDGNDDGAGTGSPPSPELDAPCADCTTEEVGVGGAPFDLEASPGGGVVLDAGGALILKRAPSAIGDLIWIANTGEDTLTRFNTKTFEEEGRYRVPLDPSRTSVGLSGNAYVGSRLGTALTKVSARGSACADRNGDGVVTTSGGGSGAIRDPAYASPGPGVTRAGDFEDDCIVWSTGVGGDLRGIVVQDGPGRVAVTTGALGEPVVELSPDPHWVWAGGLHDSADGPGTLYKFDSNTGKLLFSTASPLGIYGMAVDDAGVLWVTGGGEEAGKLAFIDTRRCQDAASCDVQPCVVACTVDDCPTTCDGAIKGVYDLDPAEAYGITVDCKQRVWLSNHIGPMKRFDPRAAPSQRYRIAGSSSDNGHGVGADASGFVWSASTAGQVIRLDAETLEAVRIPAGSTPKGIGIDADGKVWSVNEAGTVHVIVPGASIGDNSLSQDVIAGLDAPYTYSDMTGQQLRLVTRTDPGSYQQVFEGCDSRQDSLEWRSLEYRGEAPEGTWVIVRVRSSSTLAGLEDRQWRTVGWLPGAGERVDLRSALLGQLAYLEVQVELVAASTPAGVDGCEVPPELTPKLTSLAVTRRCEAPPMEAPPPADDEPPPPDFD